MLKHVLVCCVVTGFLAVLNGCGSLGNDQDIGQGVDILEHDAVSDVSATDGFVNPDVVDDAADVADVGTMDDEVHQELTDAGDLAHGDGEYEDFGCRLQMIPEFVNFGTVAVGSDESLQIRLVNTGTRTCEVTSAKIVDCPANEQGEPVCPPIGDAEQSQFFGFDPDLDDIPVQVAAGTMLNVQVRFDTSAEATGVGPAGQMWGLASFTVKDVDTDKVSTIPGCGGDCDPNMLGYTVKSQARVLPGIMNFGPTAPECGAGPRNVCIYNTGVAPVSLDLVTLSECGDEFSLLDLPALPVEISAGSSSCFEVSYIPDDAGSDECLVRIVVNGAADSVINMNISGNGYADTNQVDEFVHQRSDAVDILFVLDDSGSMCDEQAVMLDSFETFIERARNWNNDFHIGVINVDVTDTDFPGFLNRGSTDGVRYLTNSPDILDEFPALAGIGCDGSSVTESGLHAALTALMPPLTTDTKVECELDSDCGGNTVICPDGPDCPYKCVDGTCAGFNKGFLRDDARLEVIVMSDEDDQSVMEVAVYVKMLQDLKSAIGDDVVHVHAIVGVEDEPLPGDEYSACTSPGGSTALAGTRYIQAAEVTGGVTGSICEGSYDDIMLSISQKVFTDGGSLRYFLSRPADSTSIVVALNPGGSGEYSDCVGGWEYDDESNSVVIDPEGGCVPDAGDMVRLTYQVVCL